ncbi:SMC-Scp complex subunit ScpB [Aldersonia kunmingensis]|uniref:SMC-Scp complex subunit ScpB n=1 Tax=Aldersonia kunmingensis TaxID=408066 RepID=UPI000A024AA5|nr:SMC-Scp complex subunit ScpB [Aldersonia kunmingensis]
MTDFTGATEPAEDTDPAAEDPRGGDIGDVETPSEGDERSDDAAESAGGEAVDTDEDDDGGDAAASEDYEPLSDTELHNALEAMLLVVDEPASAATLAGSIDEPVDRVEAMLREIAAELTARRSGFDLRAVGEGWRLYTRSAYAPYVERLLLDGARSKLTRAALETLAVIAYRQPVTRARVSAVRGVNVDGVMRTLLARGLISEAGSDSQTSATLYATTELFLERIGLGSLAELPQLAPLLPDVDLIDEINDSLDTDPRYMRLRKRAEPDASIELADDE